MNVTHQGIVTLLRSAITGEKISLPEGFSLEEADAIIRGQSLLPMAYQGAYNCGISAEMPLMGEYKTKYFQYLIRSERQLQAVSRIFRAFEENGIDYLPLKGCNLKKLYPQPELRPMGDADILIRRDQYEVIRPIMEGLGYREDVQSNYDVHWIGKDLLVELHVRLFGENQVDLCRYYDDGWRIAVKGGGFRHDMTAEDAYVYIFCHMMKHFRFCGIGARQIVDLYVYRRAYPQMDEEKISRLMEMLHLSEFRRNILRLLSVWFEGRESDPVTDYITAYVFASGNFGTMENKLYAEEIIKANRAGGVRSARRKSLWAALFPPLSDMQLSYNILFRHPWLCPVYYVVRWVDVFLHRRKNIRKKLGIIRNMSDEKVDAHRQALNFMGLDFHYEEA